MPSQSILSVAPISTTFWICSTRSPTPSSSSWSRTIARRRTLWMPPIRSLRRTRIRYARQSSAKTTEARNSSSPAPIPTWRNPIRWQDAYSRFTTTRVTTTATSPSYTAPMHKVAPSRKPCANATSSIASTEACRSISARRSRISSAICDSSPILPTRRHLSASSIIRLAALAKPPSTRLQPSWQLARPSSKCAPIPRPTTWMSTRAQPPNCVGSQRLSSISRN